MSSESRDSSVSETSPQNEAPTPFAIYLSSITEAFPELSQEITTASTRVLEEKFKGNIADSVSWAVFYNEVAGELSGISTQVAAELYARAYDTERSYREGTFKPIFASNFIRNYNHSVRTIKNPTKKQKEWISDRKDTLVDAGECTYHFWYDIINQEGFRQAPKRENDETELAGDWDPEALAQVTSFFEDTRLARQLQDGPLKFI